MRPCALIRSTCPTFYYSFIYSFFCNSLQELEPVLLLVCCSDAGAASWRKLKLYKRVDLLWPHYLFLTLGTEDGSGGDSGDVGGEVKGLKHTCGRAQRPTSSPRQTAAVANCFNRIKRHLSSHHHHYVNQTNMVMAQSMSQCLIELDFLLMCFIYCKSSRKPYLERNQQTPALGFCLRRCRKCILDLLVLLLLLPF